MLKFSEEVVDSIDESLLAALPVNVFKLADTAFKLAILVLLLPVYEFNDAVVELIFPILVLLEAVYEFNEAVVEFRLLMFVSLEPVYWFSDEVAAANCASVANVASSDELNDSNDVILVENEPDHIDEEPIVVVKSTPFSMKDPVMFELICFIYRLLFRINILLYPS
jgi:hypothetical protein